MIVIQTACLSLVNIIQIYTYIHDLYIQITITKFRAAGKDGFEKVRDTLPVSHKIPLSA